MGRGAPLSRSRGAPGLIAAVTLVGLVFCGFVLDPAAASAGTFDVTVPGTSNIFGAGIATPPEPGGGGGGTAPVLITLPAGTGRVLTLTGASGLINCCSGTPDTPPTGAGSGSNINPYGGLSGFMDNHSTPLVGVFLADAPPSGSGPATIDSSTHHDDSDVSPILAQIFYLGDGTTATSRATQTFHVPDDATRLYLGTADGLGFNGDTGYYNDNTGQWQIQGQISGQAGMCPSGQVGTPPNCTTPPPPPTSCVSGPGNPPRAVVILLTGIDSQLPYSESYDPVAQSYCDLYSTLTPALADLSEMAIQSFDSSSDGLIQPVNLTDALAESGTLLLPFSYNGSTLSGPSAHPTYSVESFGKNVPGERLPDVEADTYLLKLVHQVHGLWKNTPIFVIGHSNGGLIAEQLFERHSVKELEGVTRIVSLDSPINGLGIPLGVSGQLGDFYHNRWQSRAALQTQMLRKEKQSNQLLGHPLFLPIGTEGDTLYQWADELAPGHCPGIESQLIWRARPCTSDSRQGFPIFSRITREPATFGAPSWPSQGGSGLTGLLGFDSHKFVMQSPDNIAFLDQLVGGNAAYASATTSSVNGPRGPLTASITSATVRYEQMNYTPRIRARLSHEIAAEGGTIMVLGSGFGTSPGTVRILGNTSAVELPVKQWTPVQITVGVPAHAVTGLVSVTTPAAGTAVAGLAAVTASQRTRVVRLTYVRVPRVFEGEPQTIEVRAKDARGHVVRGAAVQVIGAGEAFDAVTSRGGVASIALRGFGCQPILAISGGTTLNFRVCWQKPKREKMVLSVLRKRRAVTIRASIKAGKAVRGETVHFSLAAGKCARLTRSYTRTNSRGTTSVQLLNHCGTSVMVEAITNHDTLVQGVLVAP
jgi:pimeloyl-ACP methyl ester carboxylesterase